MPKTRDSGVRHNERALPAIGSGNGVPFASPNALFTLSKLSVWWLRLGIAIERIKPGRPQQNGRHERMHLTLCAVTLRPGWTRCCVRAGQVADGLPGGNRTPDPRFRKPVLYPAELPGGVSLVFSADPAPGQAGRAPCS